MTKRTRPHLTRDVINLSAYQGRLSPYNEVFARKLSVEHLLEGHEGCVNRVCWNENGTFLASASDDRKVCLWRFPEPDSGRMMLQTEHVANIFGVRFLPSSDNRRVVTGAMDATVQLHELDAPKAAASARRQRQRRTVRWTPEDRPQHIDSRTTTFTCHTRRVKAVEVAPGDPHLFWSGAEDSQVRQYDTRCRFDSQGHDGSPNVLISLGKHNGKRGEVKCMSINKANPNQLAVGADDQYVRLWDRRMLSTGTRDRVDYNLRPMMEVAPAHLCLGGPAGRNMRQHTTGVAFGARGDRVVAIYHADHVYAFDITGSSADASRKGGRFPFLPGQRSSAPAGCPRNAEGAFHSAQSPIPMDAETTSHILPGDAELYRTAGNRAYFEKDWSSAIEQYTQGIHLVPDAAALYSHRAGAYLQRKWQGDAWLALQDCERASQLGPRDHKAAHRRIQALKELGLLQAAIQACSAFEACYPARASEVVSARAAIQDDMNTRHKEAVRRHKTAREVHAARTAARARSQPAALHPPPQAREHQPPSDDLQGGQHNGLGPTQNSQASFESEAGAGSSHVGSAAHDSSSPRLMASESNDETLGRQHHRDPQASALAAVQGRHHSGTAGGLEELQTGPTAHGLLGSQQEPAAAASLQSRDDDGEPLPPSATPRESHGSQVETDGVPGPPPGSPPAAHMSVGEQAGRAELQTSALFPASDGEGGPDASEDSDEDTDADSDVFIDPDLASESDPWDDEDSEDIRPELDHGGFLTSMVPESRRHIQRYVGHANVQTDIKEVTYLGNNDELVAAGSDDGRVYIWDARSGAIICALDADEDIVNSVAAHPTLPYLATSGIEDKVRIWGPRSNAVNQDLTEQIQRNQESIQKGPRMRSLLLHPGILQAITGTHPGLLQGLLAGEGQIELGPGMPERPGGCVIS